MLGGWELGVGSCRAQRHERLALIVVEAAQAAAIAGLGYPLDQRPRAHAALACRGPASFRRHRRVRPAAGHGLLARPHSARDLLLPPPRHRRHHQRELRRRVDRPHHRAVRIRNRERIDDPRRPEGDASARARHARGEARRVHARWPARPGASRAARRRVAGRARRATRCCRFTSRLRRTGACAVGTERRSRSRSARSRWWLASRSRWRRERRTMRSKSYGPTSSDRLVSLEQRARRATRNVGRRPGPRAWRGAPAHKTP